MSEEQPPEQPRRPIPPRRATALPLRPPNAPPPKRGTAAWFDMKRQERRRKEEMRLVVAELERNGTTARVMAVAKQLGSPMFHRILNLEIKRREAVERFTTLDPVRGLAMRMLAEDFGLDLEGVNVAVRWDPATKQLSLRADPSVPAMAQAARAVTEAQRAGK